MIGVAIQGADHVAQQLARGAADVRSEIERGVARGSVLVSLALREAMTGPEARDPFWGRVGSPGPTLGVRSGDTRRRISPGGNVYRSGDSVLSAVGSPDKHVKMAEDGGTITPTSTKFLRVPTALMQTPAGVDRNIGRSVRGIPGFFILRTTRGTLWIAREAGGPKSRRIDLLYMLVRSVKMRPRKIFATVAAETQPKVDALMSTALRLAVQKVNS